MTNQEKYLKDGVDIEELTDIFEDWHKTHLNVVSYGEALFRFLQVEVKPTLTEDERVILRNINTNVYDVIGRDSGFDLYIAGKVDWKGNKVSTRDYIEQFLKDDVFQFIKERRRI